MKFNISSNKNDNPAMPIPSQKVFAFDPQKLGKNEIYKDIQINQMALQLKLQPNEQYPDHLHSSNEFCFLVQGELTDNFGMKTAPSFFVNEKGSRHTSIFAGPQGCEVLVVKGALPNIPL